jgi:GrpB-like predicted nucleotidyltransferase (UPF0157 family)
VEQPPDVAMIGRFEHRPVACLPYDPRAPEVARRVAALIQGRMPDARVEHIGSTAVPGCAGKGVVDLLLLYPPGRLAEARDVLDGLGFQRQGGRDPWPEERPMRIGTLRYDGITFPLHVHVVAAGSADAAHDLRFRDLLRADPALAAAYVAEKHAILAAGTTDGPDYAGAKGPFIWQALASAEDAAG